MVETLTITITQRKTKANKDVELGQNPEYE